VGPIEYRYFNRIILGSLMLVGMALFMYAMLSLPLACVWHSQYGIDCPTCYLTRALRMISTGSYANSAALHPGALALICFLLVQIACRIYLEFKPAHVFTIDASISSLMIMALWFVMNVR